MSDYRNEFPDFDGTLPVIEGMPDTSWHNDTMPSLRGRGMVLWCNYADEALRETEGGKLYTLLTDEEEFDATLLFETDDLAEMLAFVERRA